MAQETYTRTAIVLHWLIALFILFNLSLGWFMEGFAPPVKMLVLSLHISSGISVLGLTVLRVLWRLTHHPPAHDPPLAPAEAHGAHIVYFLLYAGMVLMPLTGWAILSAHPAPGSDGAAALAAQHPANAKSPGGKGPGAAPKLWWLVPLPLLAPMQEIGQEPGGLPAQKRLHGELVDWHGCGGWLMLALLALHIAGAAKHQFVDRAPLLQRMGVGRRPMVPA